MLKVAILLADIFSLGEIKSKNKDFIKLFNNPNFFQTKTQFLWDYMFWIVVGNAICYVDTKIATKENQVKYWLHLGKIYFSESLKSKLSKPITSQKTYNELLNEEIEYRIDSKNVQYYKLKDLIFINDTSNGLDDNYLIGKSRLDALYKVITNTEIAIDAKKDNLDFSRKFLVNGNISEDNITQLPMGEQEKKDIEEKLTGKKKIFAVKTPIKISRFTDSLAKLELGKSYSEDLHIIGNMYNIPKDVIEAIGNGTFDNQRTARASLVEYALKAKGDDFIEAFSKHYGFDSEKDESSISWEHLSFNQTFENEKADTITKKANALDILVRNGADANEAANLLNLDLKFKKNENII